MCQLYIKKTVSDFFNNHHQRIAPILGSSEIIGEKKTPRREERFLGDDTKDALLAFFAIGGVQVVSYIIRSRSKLGVSHQDQELALEEKYDSEFNFFFFFWYRLNMLSDQNPMKTDGGGGV